MIFDILMVAILALSMVLGFRSGFVYSLVHTAGWIVAVAASLFLDDKVGLFIEDHLGLRTKIYDAFYARVMSSMTAGTESLSNLPSILSNAVEGVQMNLATEVAGKLTDVTYSVLMMVLIAAVVKLVLWLITMAFSRRNNDGFTGIPDGILGMSVGFLRGILILFVIFALLVPVTSMMSPETATSVMASLESSSIAYDFYDNNLLLLVINSILA